MKHRYKIFLALAFMLAGQQCVKAGSPRLVTPVKGAVCYVKHVSTGLFLSASEGQLALGSAASATTFQLEEVDQRSVNRNVFYLASPDGRLSASFYGDFAADGAGYGDEWSVEPVAADSSAFFLGVRVPDAYARQYLYWSEVKKQIDVMRCRFDASYVDAQWQLVGMDEIDGIEPAMEDRQTNAADSPAYDLQGRRASESQPGIIIRDHKKTINQ